MHFYFYFILFYFFILFMLVLSTINKIHLRLFMYVYVCKYLFLKKKRIKTMSRQVFIMFTCIFHKNWALIVRLMCLLVFSSQHRPNTTFSTIKQVQYCVDEFSQVCIMFIMVKYTCFLVLGFDVDMT